MSNRQQASAKNGQQARATKTQRDETMTRDHTKKTAPNRQQASAQNRQQARTRDHTVPNRQQANAQNCQQANAARAQREEKMTRDHTMKTAPNRQQAMTASTPDHTTADGHVARKAERESQACGA